MKDDKVIISLQEYLLLKDKADKNKKYYIQEAPIYGRGLEYVRYLDRKGLLKYIDQKLRAMVHHLQAENLVLKDELNKKSLWYKIKKVFVK